MTSALVIGAGPYGLSVGAHLRGRGVDARVLGVPMGAWRENMPAGMLLKSEPRASSLSAPSPGSTLQDYCSSIGRAPFGEAEPVPIELFVDYGLWFARRNVPEVEDTTVNVLRRAGNEFEVELSSGETLRVPSVVVATGHVAYANMPLELRRLAADRPSPEGLASHASQHQDFGKYAGKRVAVVGRGQSALESAALLREAGASVTVLVRANEVLWNDPPTTGPQSVLTRLRTPTSGLGRGWRLVAMSRGQAAIRLLPEPRRLEFMRTVLGPAGAWWLRERLEGRVDIVLGSRFDVTPGPGETVHIKLSLAHSDPKVLEVDHVLAGTGYQVNIDSLPFLDGPVRAALRRVADAPRLNRSFESSVAGLYFTGLAAAPTFGPSLRFVSGTRFASRSISRAIAR